MLQIDNIFPFSKLYQGGRAFPVQSRYPEGQQILGVQGWAPCIPPSCLGFACCICKLFQDLTLQLHASVCQCINVIPAMLRMCLTNREKPKPRGVWFMPVTGWTYWQTLEAARPKSVEMDKPLR